jgi:hypothetical protein
VDLHQREAGTTGDALALGDLQRLAGELGIPAETVQRALVQVRTEALALPSAPPVALDRIFGAATVVAARSVPGPRHEVVAAIEAMLRAELFRIERNLGDKVIWENPDSLMHRARRLFDVGGRLRLGVARRITVTLHGSSDARVDVRLEADLELRRSGQVRKAGLAMIGWSSMGAVIAALLAAPVSIVPAATGLVLAGTFAMGSRRSYLRDRDAVGVALERFLDYLERERLR